MFFSQYRQINFIFPTKDKKLKNIFVINNQAEATKKILSV
jgi:hypothetical protein